MNDSDADEFYGLLVPLADERLLLPRSCTAEVVSWSAPTPMAGAPPWYVGTVNWNGRPIPVMSVEAALGRPVPQPTSSTVEPFQIPRLTCANMVSWVGAITRS